MAPTLPSSAPVAAPRAAARTSSLLLWSALCLQSSACEPPAADELDLSLASPREAWSAHDDPSLLAASFEYVLDELPRSGTAKRLPWPGSYWPSYIDSINYRWAGANSHSPAAKYGLAFGKSGVEDAVSRDIGVDSVPGKSCEQQSDCAKGEVCARRRGEKGGRCAETWYGICDAWAAASLLEREPQKAVTYGGVRFEVNDIKALASMAYREGVKFRSISLRCDEQGGPAHLAKFAACRDTNAGSFHVAVTNLLGRQRRAFVHDRSYDYVVWNFPVVAYRVTHDTRLTAAGANQLLGVQGPEYAFNDDAVELRRVRLELVWVNVASPNLNGPLTAYLRYFALADAYEYILELDDDGAIVGGEWIGASRRNHPDFLWMPVEKVNATAAGVIEYSDVKKLLDLADGS